MTGRCTFCDRAVYGDAAAHPCCVIWIDGRGFPECPSCVGHPIPRRWVREAIVGAKPEKPQTNIGGVTRRVQLTNRQQQALDHLAVCGIADAQDIADAVGEEFYTARDAGARLGELAKHGLAVVRPKQLGRRNRLVTVWEINQAGIDAANPTREAA